MSTALQACQRCGGRKVCLFEEHGRAVARVCDCADACAECGGARFLHVRSERGYVEARPCGCAVTARRADAYSRARIPARYRDKTFEFYVAKTPAQARVQARLYDFAKTFAPKDRGVLLQGPVGVGKTHLLVATLAHLTLERAIDCRFEDFFHLLGTLKDGYSRGLSDGEILGALCEVDLLAIDELGKGRNTDWEYAILDQLVSRRYNLGKTTLFTTNYIDAQPTSPPQQRGFGSKQAPASLVETLEERVGARIHSRLREMCEFLTLDGPDHRKGHQAG